jgi:fumarylpyruvate hydrolase
MQFSFPPSVIAVVPIADSHDFFPVHRIYCVGRNYADHAKEMGGTGREAPFFFMKPADAVLPIASGTVGEMRYPPRTSELHHEIELVVAIGKGGSDIKAADALDHVWGYAVGLDMTRRDLQAKAKQDGRPWSTAKGFDQSAPISPIYPIARTGPMNKAAIYLEVNEHRRQNGDVDQMIWTIPETIEILSQYFELLPGDLIFTGTPAGVASVERGDVLRGGIEGLATISVKVV